ncbi:UNVERIFIED_CONTAM: hypothetical protein HDU68_007241, partial [Siphonaria sp. JEL0065]
MPSTTTRTTTTTITTVSGTTQTTTNTVKIQTPSATTNESSPIEKADWKALTAEIESIRSEFKIPGVAVGVVYKGELVYSAGFGTRNDARDPVTADTLFQIGSTTKAFTAFGFGTLVDDKKVDWRTPVTSIDSVEFQDPVANKHANFIDLMSHRTGLPRHDLLMNIWSSVEEVNSKIKYLQPSKQFREAFQYNNNMWNLVGSIAGRLHGSTWDDLISEKILKPLNMKNTFTSLAEMEKSENHARGYSIKEDGKVKVYGYNEHGCVEDSEGDGSILSCVNDLAKWVALINRKGKTVDGKALISDEQFSTIMTPHAIDDPAMVPPGGVLQLRTYGLGWSIVSYRGKVRIGHGGGMPGYITMINTFPNDDVAVIVLSNADAGIPGTVANTIADRLLFPDIEPDWTTKFRTGVAGSVEG